MKIAMLAPFEEQVPPKKYGGTELVVANLTEGLVARGHDVTLFATGDSHTSATLYPVFPEALRQREDVQADTKLREMYKYVGVADVVQQLIHRKFDVVHNHIGWRALPFASYIDAPIVTTLHGPLTPLSTQQILKRYAQLPYISISLSQQRPLPDITYAANVYNGIDTNAFTFFKQHKGYVAFLGRMSPEKGPVEAITIAKAAGLPLVMAAKVDTVDKDYFDTEVAPLIDGDQIKFIGEVDHAGKVELLGNALALLAPIQWEEPFGLFMVEALACGTPVIAIGRGSVPELIENGKTGFIIENSVEQAVEALAKIATIKREDCRAACVKRFSINAMVDGYENVYRALTKKAATLPNSHRPVTTTRP